MKTHLEDGSFYGRQEKPEILISTVRFYPMLYTKNQQMKSIKEGSCMTGTIAAVMTLSIPVIAIITTHLEK
ncbi:hypothetical protein [Jeotgalibacillus soli]|nr:hypothetical protein [Jeotgalibacillus soli]